MARQPLHQLPREPIPGELVPAHYFRPLEPQELGRPGHPLEIDLGCGDGSFLRAMAEHYPERDFLGVERLLGRVRKVCRKAQRQGLSNLQVLRLDSKYLVEWLLPSRSVSRLHLLCPDPWPKAKHHRRRLIQVPFLEAVERVLADDGEFLFMTDHPEYHEWAQEKLGEFGGFELLEWEEDSFFYPKTDFQLQWEAEGKSMMRMRMVRAKA
ncbi:MAG: tRNA (guanosine(46)-N7)-methyltransferase TrmB [Akkermansiaceae bacterium]|nr:tRNA (guanosine(46)-N7)-methyltransferase TrmB [Akkermansiaceae bacterium]